MSAAPASGAAPPPARPASMLSRIGMELVRRVLIGLALTAALLIGAGVGVRYGVRTRTGRAAVVKLLDGLDLGAMGRLHVAGISGDLFDAFGVQTLSIVDAKGPWLVARNLVVVWDPAELLARRVHAQHLRAALVQVLRRPEMKVEPPRPPSKPPVSLVLDEVKLRLETAPAFSVQHGLWDLAGKADLRRNGRLRATLTAKSLLHAGDGASLALRVGKTDRFLLRADAVEADGGALAGALGLPANRSLTLHAAGDGTSAQGQASLEAESGADRPLQAQASWGRPGLLAKARVSLAASRLTKFFADRLGPEAGIDLSARQIKGDLYDVHAALVARDGAIHLAGPIDSNRRSTSGLALTLAVADLSKWVATPKIGPAEVRGVAQGTTDRFTLKGTFQGQRLDQLGYTLARIAGPAEVGLNAGEWRIKADLDGAGGGGKGLAPTLLGGAPKVALDLSILKDGHLLFRTLNVAGAGLKLAAQGAQGLFGRLSFKGSADILNLGLLHPGARGGLTGAWDAGQSPGGRGWDFAFDGKGSGFASGSPDLDHFLGAAPRLTAKGTYGGGGLLIQTARLDGAAVQVQGKGGLDARQGLDVDLDWTAKGPILAGPLEIAGAAKGSGKISGTLSAPRADLVAELASLDLGPLVVTPAKLTATVLEGRDGVTGAAAVSGPTTAYGPASAKAAFRVAPGGLDLNDIVADAGGVKLAGSLALRSGEPSSADLSLVAGPGAFLTAGRLSGTVRISDQAPSRSGTRAGSGAGSGAGGGAEADLSLTGEGVAIAGAPLRLRTLRLQARGPLRQLPFQLAADSLEPTPLSFSGAGTLEHGPNLNRVTLKGGGRWRKAEFKLLEPAVVRLGGADQGLQAKLAIAGGQADVKADAVGDAFNAVADLQNVGLQAFSGDFTGTASGALTLHGRGSHLEGSMNGALAGARSRDAPANEGLNLALKATLADSRLHLDAAAGNAEGLKSDLALDLPAETSAAPFRIALDRTRPVQGRFSVDGEVRPLWDLIAGGERTLSGHLATAGTIHGSLNALLASGQGALTGGRFRDVATGLALQNLQIAAVFGDNAVVVQRFSGADARGGSVSGDGRVSFAADGASTFTLELKRFQLIDNDLGRATASGAVTVTHPAKGEGKLSGQLTIDRADIVAATPTPTGVVPMDVVEVNKTLREGEAATPTRSLGPPILMDVGLKAARGLYVKGKGLNVELSLDAHVGGAVNQPVLTGVARVVTGSYDFAGKRFDVDSSGLVHLGATPSQIRLDLSATWEDPTLTAVVRVKGTAAKPEIALTSVPVLPQDEVLSRVLFGVSAAQLSAAQGAELASALASLTGGGGFDVIGNLRQFAGLDRLAIGGTQATGTTISGGKYINKDVYLELTGGGRNGSGAQVEWRIRHNLSLVSRYGAALDPRYSNDADASLSIRFRKDF